MSDSRITQAVEEVAAGLVDDALETIHLLLDEDPSFAGPVLLGLQCAQRHLVVGNAEAGLSALRTADACENRVRI